MVESSAFEENKEISYFPTVNCIVIFKTIPSSDKLLICFQCVFL